VTIPAGASGATLTRAIEENAAEFLLAMGRAGGGEELRRPDLQWIIGGSPIDYHNCVVRAHLTPDAVDAAIVASVERFTARHVPGTWHVGPTISPPDLTDRLVAHGFVADGDDIGMAIGLDPLPQPPPAPEGLTIEPVTDESGLSARRPLMRRSGSVASLASASPCSAPPRRATPSTGGWVSRKSAALPCTRGAGRKPRARPGDVDDRLVGNPDMGCHRPGRY